MIWWTMGSYWRLLRRSREASDGLKEVGCGSRMNSWQTVGIFWMRNKRLVLEVPEGTQGGLSFHPYCCRSPWVAPFCNTPVHLCVWCAGLPTAATGIQTSWIATLDGSRIPSRSPVLYIQQTLTQPPLMLSLFSLKPSADFPLPIR